MARAFPVRFNAARRLGENTHATSRTEKIDAGVLPFTRARQFLERFSFGEFVAIFDRALFGKKLAIPIALMDRSGAVALFGKLSVGCASVRRVAAEFGWSFKRVSSAGALQRLECDYRVIAVLVEARELDISWMKALECLHQAAPSARVIACRRFSDNILWTELAEAGAFHDLHLPLDTLETRRALGFVWAAQQRVLKIAAAIPIPMPQRRAS